MRVGAFARVYAAGDSVCIDKCCAEEGVRVRTQAVDGHMVDCRRL